MYTQEKAARLLGMNRSTFRIKLAQATMEGVMFPSGGISELFLNTFRDFLNNGSTKDKITRVLTICDLHIPFQDNLALEAVNRFVNFWQPDELVIAGDLLDFYVLSRFSKDPKRCHESGLQVELDLCKQVLSELRTNMGNKPITLIGGNHEERLTKYLQNKAPELISLRCLTVPYLLGLPELNINYIEPNDTFYLGEEFIVEHGSLVRQDSSYTAKGQLTLRGISGISGHSHRMGVHRKTDMSGNKIWIEGGCLCSLFPEYVKFPNWQQAVTVVYLNENRELISIDQPLIINGKIFYYGQMI